ncbi:unnamed protein product, partial [Brachionus calyciflorus]
MNEMDTTVVVVEPQDTEVFTPTTTPTKLIEVKQNFEKIRKKRMMKADDDDEDESNQRQIFHVSDNIDFKGKLMSLEFTVIEYERIINDLIDIADNLQKDNVGLNSSLKGEIKRLDLKHGNNYRELKKQFEQMNQSNSLSVEKSSGPTTSSRNYYRDNLQTNNYQTDYYQSENFRNNNYQPGYYRTNYYRESGYQTWFNDSNTQQLDGYKLFFKNRSLSKHGGVAIYVKSELKSFENVENEFLNESIEQVWCTLLCGCIYRPPKSLNNIPIFESISSFPTFVKSSGISENVLDLIITESSDRILDIESSPPLGNVQQGHLVLEWIYRTCSNSKKNLSSLNSDFNFRKADFLSMSSEFSNRDWPGIFKNKTSNEMYEAFINEYNDICNICVPLKSKKTKKFRPKWLNSSLKELSDEKNIFWLKCRKSKFRNKKYVAEYLKIKNECSKMIRKAVRKYESELALREKKDPKLVFNYMKNKQKFKGGIGAIKTDNATITDENKIAEIINQYFKSVFSLHNPDSPLPEFKKRTDKVFTINPFISFGPENVEKYLNKVNVNKSV